MLSQSLFCSEFELGHLVVPSGVLQESRKAILDVERGTDQNGDGFSSASMRVKLSKHPKKAECTVVSFATTDLYTHDKLRKENDLVSSSSASELKIFDFLCTKEYPDFKLNKAVVDLFKSNYVELSDLKSKVVKSKRLIICGRSLGGSIASLFTLMLLENIDSASKEQKLPLCITFGSPLIGDSNLQKLISQNSPWDSCFLNFASLKDPIPKALVSQADPKTCAYKPFGIYLLCSDQNFTCFEDQEIILELLGKMGPSDPQSQSVDYGELVKRFESKVRCKDTFESTEQLKNSLEAGILAQLQAIGVQQEEQNINLNALVKTLETSIKRKMLLMNMARRKNEKINEVKENMAHLEWYKKTAKKDGYYDSFKKESSKSDLNVIKLKRALNIYWKRVVEEVERKPQMVRTRHLFGGTNYRRMVEPLDIAEYYKEGETNYLEARKLHEEYKHYYKLEQMLKNTKESKPKEPEKKKVNVDSILTEDSCFWAHVEEAIITCRKLKNGDDNAKTELIEFEMYVMKLIKNYSVHPEIFSGGSTFIKWWKDYESISENFSQEVNLPLSSFMKKGEYEKYMKGEY